MPDSNHKPQSHGGGEIVQVLFHSQSKWTSKCRDGVRPFQSAPTMFGFKPSSFTEEYRLLWEGKLPATVIVIQDDVLAKQY